MDEEKKTTGCTGHCENCSMTQRVYCAAQISLYNQREIALMKETQDKILASIESIKPQAEELYTIHGAQSAAKVPLDEIEE